MRPAKLVRLLLCPALALLVGAAAFAAKQPAAAKAAPGEAGREKPRVLVATFSGIITPVSAEYMTSAIDQAESDKDDAVVIELDTPGGLDSPMRDVVKAILGSQTPVIVYVAPAGARAASAGVFITMAAHVAAMAPGTNIGAAHPVTIGRETDLPKIGKEKEKEKGKDSGESVMESKLANDAGAYLETIAARRGRNTALAMEMVKKSTSVISVRAVAENIVDFEADSLDDLLTKADGRKLTDFPSPLRTANAAIERYPMTGRQRLLASISDPNIAMLLMSIGGAGILIELYNPGLILPGVVGTVSLVLAFYSFQTLSASYAGVLLMLLGMLFFVLELKIASHGLLALSGAASLLFGALMVFRGSPEGISISYTALASSLVTILVLVAGLIWVSKRALTRKREIGLEDIKGEEGVAKTALDPQGMVFWHGELWKAESMEGGIPEGSRVLVERAEGLVLKVRKRPPA